MFLDEETLLQKETYVKSAEKIFVFLDEYLSESPLCCSVCANRMSVIAIIRDPRSQPAVPGLPSLLRVIVTTCPAAFESSLRNVESLLTKSKGGNRVVTASLIGVPISGRGRRKHRILADPAMDADP